MRTLAEVLSSGKDGVDKKISKTAELVDATRLKSMVTSNMKAVEDISHSLVTTMCLQQPNRGEPSYRTSDVTDDIIAGPIAWRALVVAHGKAV